MASIPIILLTLLALAGIVLATVAGIIVLVAAIVIMLARRKRRNAVPAVEPAE